MVTEKGGRTTPEQTWVERSNQEANGTLMPSAATKAKRAAAKAEKDAEKAALEARLDAVVARMEVVQSAAVAELAAPDDAGSRMATAPGAELDEVYEVTMQLAPRLEIAGASSPQKKLKLLQPSTTEPSPGGKNLVHTLQDATPRGTHTASAQYTTAAATPEGEDGEAREKRHEAEASRRYRARQSVQRSLEKQVVVEQESSKLDELDAALDRLRTASPGLEQEQAARVVRNTYAEYITWRDAVIEKLTIKQVYHIAEARGALRERLLTAKSQGAYATVRHEEQKAEKAEGRSSMGLFIIQRGEDMHQSDGGLRWQRFVGLNQQTGSYQCETVCVDDGWGDMSCQASFCKVLKQMNADPESTVALPHPDEQLWQEVSENCAARAAALESWRQAERTAGRDGLTYWERYDKEMAAWKGCEHCKSMYCFRGLKCPSNPSACPCVHAPYECDKCRRISA